MLQLIIGLCVIAGIIGGASIGILQLDKTYIAPQYGQKPTNSVKVWEDVFYDNNWPVVPPIFVPADSPQTMSIVIPYGVCDATGGLIPFTSPSPLPIVLVDNTNVYGIKFSVNGITREVVYGVTPDAPVVYSNSYTSPTIRVVIKRSEDLQTWTAVFTNPACAIDSFNYFEDADAPYQCAFYVAVIAQ